MARLILTRDGRLLSVRAVPLKPASVAGSGTVGRPAEPRPVNPMASGEFFRVTSSPAEAIVTPPLARELSNILERFAREHGFIKDKPLEVAFGRGVLGLHRFSRAADIYGVGGKNMAEWVKSWNIAMQKAGADQAAAEKARIVAEEKQSNLGYRLYRALKTEGRWAQPKGYPVQLFGPWTRAEGPHKAISDRMLYAHRDHIHMAL